MINTLLQRLGRKFALIALLLTTLFFITRLVNISSNPPSLYWDEASIGYNAYSISINLRDEWGKFLPVHFRAFGEFKLPVYIYSVATFVKIFGLSVFSIRAPAVFYTFAAIIITGLIVYELSKNKWLSLLTTFFLVVSPWIFIFSRTGYEATAGSAFFLFGLYTFILSFKKKSVFLLTTISIVASMYSYNSFRIISPIIFSAYLTIFVYKFRLNKKSLVLGVVSLSIFLISLLPIYKLVTKDAGTARLTAVAAGSVKEIFSNYFSHFSTNFLLFNGDTNPRSQIPGFGELWIFDPIIIILGIIFAISKKDSKYLLIILALAISFIPAALTKESPHALRSLSAVYFYAIFWTFGFWFLFKHFGKRSFLTLGLILIVNLVMFFNYLGNFYTSYLENTSKDWQYGYAEIFRNYESDITSAKRVVISDQYAQPYIFALYYQKIEPSKFLESRVLNTVDNWGFSTVKSFGKFKFEKILPNDIQSGDLVFATPIDLLPKLMPTSEIKFLDGSIAFYVYKP